MCCDGHLKARPKENGHSSWLTGERLVVGLRSSLAISMAPVPCYLVLSTGPLTSWYLVFLRARAQRERLWESQQDGSHHLFVTVFGNGISSLFSVLFIRRGSRCPAHTWVETHYIKLWIPGGGNLKEPLYKLPVTEIFLYCNEGICHTFLVVHELYKISEYKALDHSTLSTSRLLIIPKTVYL